MPFTEISKGFETSDNKPVSIDKMNKLIKKLNSEKLKILH